MLKLDYRRTGLNARKLGEALGLARTSKEFKGVGIAHAIEAGGKLRKLARRSPDDAQLVAAFQGKLLEREPTTLTRRGLLRGAFGSVLASALPVPMAVAQIAGHTPISVRDGQYGLLVDGICLFNDWSALPTYGPQDGNRTGVMIYDAQFCWFESVACGGSWLGPTDSGAAGQRQATLKLNGYSNGVRRCLFLGASRQSIDCWAQNSNGDSVGARILHSVLAGNWNGGIRAIETLSHGFELSDFVGINNVIHNVGLNPENANNGHAIWVQFDATHGDWRDNIFWLHGAFNTNATIRVDVFQGGGPGIMTIADAVASYPNNFAGCIAVPSMGFVFYRGSRHIYTDIAAAFADMATQAGSPLRGAGRHLTRVASSTTNSNSFTMVDPTMFRSVAAGWGHPNYGVYGARGGMGCYIEGVGYRTFVSHNPAGTTTVSGAPMSLPANTRIFDLSATPDIGMAQAA